jgi:putative salt-induced outer membrane protein
VNPAFHFSPRLFLRLRSFRPLYLRTLPAVTLGAVAVTLFSMAAWADTVVLKNGDHLTGSVTQIAGGKLTIHTDYAGDVAISFDQVSSVKVEKPIVLSQETKKGKKVDIHKTEITAIDRTDTGYTVTTASGTETVPTAGLTTVRTPGAQQAYEASLHPGWLHDWTTTANVSFALARGNSNTTTLGTGFTAQRPTPTDKTSLYFNDIYANTTATTNGVSTASTTADNIGAGIRYDHNVNPKLFAFGTADFFEDQLQFLDLRAVAGGGFGWHAYKSPKQQLDVLGGVVWTHESYSTVPENDSTTPITPAVLPETNSFAALDFGEQYTRKLGAASLFTEQAYIFPDLADTSQYRFTANGTLSTKIKSFLSWQTTASDVYVTNPPSGTKQNDFILTTGLGFTFTRK